MRNRDISAAKNDEFLSRVSSGGAERKIFRLSDEDEELKYAKSSIDFQSDFKVNEKARNQVYGS